LIETNLPDLNNRGLKSVDVASTYVQVLIGLGSGIITAIIGFYPTLLKIDNFNFLPLKISMICFGISIGCGLLGLGSIVNVMTTDTRSDPPNAKRVRFPVMVQFILFFAGILMLFFTMPK
jgi:hypothetical protein